MFWCSFFLWFEVARRSCSGFYSGTRQYPSELRPIFLSSLKLLLREERSVPEAKNMQCGCEGLLELGLSSNYKVTTQRDVATAGQGLAWQVSLSEMEDLARPKALNAVYEHKNVPTGRAGLLIVLQTSQVVYVSNSISRPVCQYMAIRSIRVQLRGPYQGTCCPVDCTAAARKRLSLASFLEA